MAPTVLRVALHARGTQSRAGTGARRRIEDFAHRARVRASALACFPVLDGGGADTRRGAMAAAALRIANLADGALRRAAALAGGGVLPR